MPPLPPGESTGWVERETWRAYRDYRAGLCPDCRQPLHETTNPENRDAYGSGTTACYCCLAIETAQMEQQKKNQERDHPLPSRYLRWFGRMLNRNS